MRNKSAAEIMCTAQRAGIQVIERQSEIFEKNTLVREMMEGIQDAVLVLNVHRQIVFFNAKTVAFSGTDNSDDIIGMRPGEFFGCVNAENTSGGCGTSLLCRNCGAASTIQCAIRGRSDMQECTILRKAGSPLRLMVTGRPFHYEEEVYIIFCVQEISTEKRLHLLDRYFFHNILNAAGGIRNLVEVLETIDAEHFHETRRLILNLSNEMIEDVQLQRDIKSAENGELKVYQGPQSVKSMVNEVYENHCRNHTDSQRLVSEKNGEGDAVLCTDAALLRRCLGGLIRTTLATTRNGDHVRVGWEDTGDTVRFRISRSGLISEKAQKRMFEFDFSDREGRYGLGAYGIKLIVEHYLSGRVWISSDQEDDTRIYVEIRKEN